MFPRIEPVIDAFTTSYNPAWRAKKAIIISTALPKVAFSRPPNPGPTRTDNSSVAVPSILARGTIASADVMNSHSSPSCRKWTIRAMGTNTSRT